MGEGLEVVVTPIGRDRLSELEPVWRTLHAHHAAVTPRLGGISIRDRDTAWKLRLATYRRWLDQPDAFALVAERSGRIVGYAVVTVGKGFATWQVGERMADLGALAVLPEEQRAGIGSMLVDEVERHLRSIGVLELSVLTTASNEAAHRFYERRGMEEALHVFFGRIGGG